MAIGDFDADGKPDISSVEFDEDLTVLWGNGNGTFALPQAYAGATQQRAIVASDFNRDGYADLAVANYGADTVSVWLGADRTRFGARTDFQVGNEPEALAVGDFNQDGLPDLAVALSREERTDVLFGRGDGSFDSVAAYAGCPARFMLAADLNHDGLADLVSLCVRPNPIPSDPPDTTIDSASVMLGSAERVFAPPIEYSTQHLSSPGVGDLNDDGHADLFAGIYRTRVGFQDFSSVLLGNGDGTFQAEVPLLTRAASELTVADFNADGHTDLATQHWESGRLTVHLRDGIGDLPARRAEYAVGNAGPSTFADLNCDGKLDYVVSGGDPGRATVLLGNEDGTFANSTDHPADSAERLLFSDLNGDGRLDIITADSNSSAVSVLLASADGSFLPQTSHSLSGNTADINVADANADGKLDIVTVSGASGASLLLGAGDGSFVPERVLSAVRTDRMAMADIDHDGQIDSVMVEQSTNVLSVRHSAPQVEPQLQAAVPSNWILLRDVDADGHLDIFAEEGVYPGNGDGTFTTLKAFPSASGAVYRMLGDVDEDGHLDLVSHVVGSFGEHSLAILLGRGDGTFTLAHSFGSRLEAPSDVALGDFNGDTHLDLALLVDRQLEVKLGAGDASFPCVFRFPIHREATHLGAVDIDSDGRTDLVAAAREAHVISVLKSAVIRQSCR